MLICAGPLDFSQRFESSIFAPGSTRALADSPSNLEKKSRSEETVAEAKRIIDARLSLRSLQSSSPPSAPCLLLVALLLDDTSLGRVLENIPWRNERTSRDEGRHLRPRTIRILFEGIAG
jgi:hypothetical protein